MLAVARGKEGAASVRWVEGGAEKLGQQEADLILMTGHVAQFFINDAEWRNALHRIRQALRPGGWLAFETRNPTARDWESWTPQASRRVVEVPGGRLESWYDVSSFHDGLVEYACCHRFATGEVIREDGVLIFRTHDQVSASLSGAGLQTERIYGDWDRSPVSADSPELIYMARGA